MCRQNVLLGSAAVALGLGLLIGLWLKGGFFHYLIGFGSIAIGLFLLRKK